MYIFNVDLDSQEIQQMIHGIDGIINVQFVIQKKLVTIRIKEFKEKIITFERDPSQKMLVSSQNLVTRDATLFVIGLKKSIAFLHSI